MCFFTFKNASDLGNMFKDLKISSIDKSKKPVEGKGKVENNEINVAIFTIDFKV